MKRFTKAIILSSAGAVVGWIIGGMLLGNVLSLIARSGLDRGSMSRDTAFLLSPCGTFMAAGLVTGFCFQMPVTRLIPQFPLSLLFLIVGSIAIFAMGTGTEFHMRSLVTASFGVGGLLEILRRRFAQPSSAGDAETRAPEK